MVMAGAQAEGQEEVRASITELGEFLHDGYSFAVVVGGGWFFGSFFSW